MLTSKKYTKKRKIRSTQSRNEKIQELKEREKELNCLYGLTKIIRDKTISVDDALNRLIQLIPSSWQYPEIACARIKIDGKKVETPNFKETPWKISSQLMVNEKNIGSLDIFYLEKKPEADEGPFLKQERWLIDAITDILGRFFEDRQIKEELEAHRKKLDHVEKKLKKDEEKNGKTNSRSEKQNWEVIIDLLVKTDPRMILRITRKMIYHLYPYESKKINYLFSNICPVDRDAASQQWCGINMPNPRQDIESLKQVQNYVFELARKHLSPEEISNLLHLWMKQDKTRPLLLTSQKAGVPLIEITNELIRFYDKAEELTQLAPEDEMSIKTALIRRFFTDRLEYVNVAKNFMEVKDFVPLIKHMIGPAQGAGKLGGKTSGVFLAKKIIEKEKNENEHLQDIEFPKSWYITSDSIHNFIHYNDLDEVFHHKYLNPEEIRQEQLFLEQIFKNAVFQPEIIEGLRRILHDIEDKPLIIRSSSLLEDSFGSAFSGKYKSLFVPNTGTEEERLAALSDAIAEVYASTFGPDPIEYRRERGLLDFSEEMGVLIQEVIGTKIGPYFMPSLGGVAFSRNEFRWSPRIRRKDGVVRLVPGLGTRAVDRVGNDYPILVSPNRPELQVNTLVNEKIKYSPQYMDVINLETGAIETVNVLDVFKKYGESFPGLDRIVSVHKDERLSTPQKMLFDPTKSDMVVTFDGLFEKTTFLQQIKALLQVLEKNIKTPVDIEFASDGKTLYLLQCRPQSQLLDIKRKPIPKNVPQNHKLFSANKYVTTGQIEHIEYIVYVIPERYTALETREQMQQVAEVVGKLNSNLPRRKFILMGPGRWGSRGDIKLGVPVQYGDINNSSLLVEIAKEKGDYTPELSFGTHFFQDLVESDIKYLPLYPDQPDVIFNESLLLSAINYLEQNLPDDKDMINAMKDVVLLVRVDEIIDGGTLSVIMDGEVGNALAFLNPPDHWSWRMKKTHEIAGALDSMVYGIKALYLVGSTKDGSAGPASDIDLIVHFEGSEEQKEKLIDWFEKWDKRLREENKERTGIDSDEILDIHFVTDEDIKKNTAWASHITSNYESARKIPLK
jgi:predicted nucleotidyltransferase